MNRRIFRYELPINDAAHEIPSGKVVHLNEYRMKHITGERNRIEVWVEATLSGESLASAIIGTQHVQVFGTGHPIPDSAEHLATCIDGSLVWHLYRVEATK